MELNPLNSPLKPNSPKPRKHRSTYKKNSLVSKSGLNFKSLDHYISESFIQSYFPKKNQEDLDLVYIKLEDIEQDILEERINYEEKPDFSSIFTNIHIKLFHKFR